MVLMMMMMMMVLMMCRWVCANVARLLMTRVISLPNWCRCWNDAMYATLFVCLFVLHVCVDVVVVFGRCRLSPRKKVNLKHPTSNKVHTTRVRLSLLVIDVVVCICVCVCLDVKRMVGEKRFKSVLKFLDLTVTTPNRLF